MPCCFRTFWPPSNAHQHCLACVTAVGIVVPYATAATRSLHAPVWHTFCVKIWNKHSFGSCCIFSKVCLSIERHPPLNKNLVIHRWPDQMRGHIGEFANPRWPKVRPPRQDGLQRHSWKQPTPSTSAPNGGGQPQPARPVRGVNGSVRHQLVHRTADGGIGLRMIIRSYELRVWRADCSPAGKHSEATGMATGPASKI